MSDYDFSFEDKGPNNLNEYHPKENNTFTCPAGIKHYTSDAQLQENAEKFHKKKLPLFVKLLTKEIKERRKKGLTPVLDFYHYAKKYQPYQYTKTPGFPFLIYFKSYCAGRQTGDIKMLYNLYYDYSTKEIKIKYFYTGYMGFISGVSPIKDEIDVSDNKEIQFAVKQLVKICDEYRAKELREYKRNLYDNSRTIEYKRKEKRLLKRKEKLKQIKIKTEILNNEFLGNYKQDEIQFYCSNNNYPYGFTFSLKEFYKDKQKLKEFCLKVPYFSWYELDNLTTEQIIDDLKYHLLWDKQIPHFIKKEVIEYNLRRRRLL